MKKKNDFVSFRMWILAAIIVFAAATAAMEIAGERAVLFAMIFLFIILGVQGWAILFSKISPKLRRFFEKGERV